MEPPLTVAALASVLLRLQFHPSQQVLEARGQCCKGQSVQERGAHSGRPYLKLLDFVAAAATDSCIRPVGRIRHLSRLPNSGPVQPGTWNALVEDQRLD
jgi:hypothetical protein